MIQSLNVIESPRLRKIFLLLRQELKESDIPGRMAIRNRIQKAYEDYLKQLKEEMKVSKSFYFGLKILIKLVCRTQWEKYPSPQMHGLIQIRHHLWL
jgi:hypothetical protein